MATKRQQTMAKLNRERALIEKRALKQEKKVAANAARIARKNGDVTGVPESEAVDDPYPA